MGGRRAVAKGESTPPAKEPGRLAVKQTENAKRVQLQQEEKQGALTMGESSLVDVAKTHDQERRDLMVQLING